MITINIIIFSKFSKKQCEKKLYVYATCGSYVRTIDCLQDMKRLWNQKTEVSSKSFEVVNLALVTQPAVACHEAPPPRPGVRDLRRVRLSRRPQLRPFFADRRPGQFENVRTLMPWF